MAKITLECHLTFWGIYSFAHSKVNFTVFIFPLSPPALMYPSILPIHHTPHKGAATTPPCTWTHSCFYQMDFPSLSIRLGWGGGRSALGVRNTGASHIFFPWCNLYAPCPLRFLCVIVCLRVSVKEGFTTYP